MGSPVYPSGADGPSRAHGVEGLTRVGRARSSCALGAPWLRGITCRVVNAALLTSLLQSTVTMAVPLLLAALGELLAERAGIINIGLEGMLLTGAFAAMAATYVTAIPLLGLLAAWVSG